MRGFSLATMVGAALLLLAGCSNAPTLPSASSGETGANGPSSDYLIGAGDQLSIFVWRNPELSTTVSVRPDGRVSIPLVEDVVAVGKTPTALGREFEERLKQYVKDPIVTIIPSTFVGPFTQQVRVIGEAASPKAIPYRTGLTVLDVMIAVGGLTKFAAGDRSEIVRIVDGGEKSYRVHLTSLIRDGDVTENVYMAPGDILIIPQSYF
jgi:polysaccharide export outer membrane protein